MVTEPCFIDSNVPMYAGGAEHPLKDPRVALLRTVARCDIQKMPDNLRSLRGRWVWRRARPRNAERQSCWAAGVT
jgi:hypothetical protein